MTLIRTRLWAKRAPLLFLGGKKKHYQGYQSEAKAFSQAKEKTDFKTNAAT